MSIASQILRDAAKGERVERAKFTASILREIADVIYKSDSLVVYDYDSGELDVQGTLGNLAIAIENRANELEKQAHK